MLISSRIKTTINYSFVFRRKEESKRQRKGGRGRGREEGGEGF